jgi:hypothetical protein
MNSVNLPSLSSAEEPIALAADAARRQPNPFHAQILIIFAAS